MDEWPTYVMANGRLVDQSIYNSSRQGNPFIRALGDVAQPTHIEKVEEARTLIVTSNDIAWLAGLYEGEGTVQGTCIYVYQKDPWILKKIRALFGGQLRKSLGHGKRVDMWLWSTRGAHSRLLVKLILPYLSPWRVDQLRRCKLIGKN